jgi:hypothetical protein
VEKAEGAASGKKTGPSQPPASGNQTTANPLPPPPKPAPRVAAGPGSPGQPYQLVKVDNDPRVYLVKDGIKHHVESPKDVTDLGLDINKVQTVSANQLNNYRQGDAINRACPKLS